MNELNETNAKIGCLDLNTFDNKLVYGCSNGLVKVIIAREFILFINLFFLFFFNT